MRRFIIGLAFVGISVAQQRDPRQRSPRPSDKMASSLPAQDITITIHVPSELATAIEKDRWDTQIGDVDQKTGVITNRPQQPTLADQVVMRLNQTYFRQLLTLYPAGSVKAAQDEAAAKQKAAEDAVEKAATATKK